MTSDPIRPGDREEDQDPIDPEAAISPTVAGGAAPLGPTTEPATSGRRADSLLTPDVTGGSEGFAPDPGGSLLAPEVAPEEPAGNERR